MMSGGERLYAEPSIPSWNTENLNPLKWRFGRFRVFLIAWRRSSERQPGGRGAMSVSADQPVQRTAVLPDVSLRQMQLVAIIGLLGISYMFNSMDRQVFPALLSAIIPHYGLTLPQAGLVSTIFTVTVAIFGALSGWFMARFGRKAVLVGGLVAYSIFTLITPLADGFLSLATFRTLTGVGEALQIGAIYACLGGYFGNRRGTKLG
jgi:sugar phosphate permease